MSESFCFSHSLLNPAPAPLTYCTLTIDHSSDFLHFSFSCFEKTPDPSGRFFLSILQEPAMSYDFSAFDENFPLAPASFTRYGGEDLEGVFWGAKLSLAKNQLPTSPFTLFVKYQSDLQISSPFPQGKECIF